MARLSRNLQAFTLATFALAGSHRLPAQFQPPPRTAAAILAQVRETTGGDAWQRIAEIRAEGTVLAGNKTGTIATVDDLRTGANADRVDLEGVG